MQNKVTETSNTIFKQGEISTTFLNGQKGFDVESILKLVFEDMTAADVAADLDYMMQVFFEHATKDEAGANPLFFSHKYATLKLLRNAFMKGLPENELGQYVDLLDR